MISEHRRSGGGLFGPRLWGTSCRSACRSEIGRENERCFDPAWSSVCLCGPIHQKTMAKNWRTNHTLWLYPMVFVVGGRLWQKIIVWGILFWDKTILWMLLKLRDVILSSNSFEIISVFNQQPMERRLLRFREARIYLRDLVWRASRFRWFGQNIFTFLQIRSSLPSRVETFVGIAVQKFWSILKF